MVDDTPQNLSLLSDMLEPHYAVKLAPSGARALAIVAAAPPDLILLDIMMPEMDGFEVCRRLKADPGWQDIPVVFVTALTDDANRETGIGLGAVGYLTKPVEQGQLYEVIGRHLSPV